MNTKKLLVGSKYVPKYYGDYLKDRDSKKI